jgi:hypothetical protein
MRGNELYCYSNLYQYFSQGNFIISFVELLVNLAYCIVEKFRSLRRISRKSTAHLK